MKAFRALLTVLTLGVLFIYSGCGGGGGGSETIQDKQLGLLAGTSSKTWKVLSQSSGSVFKGTGDSTQYWKNFTLTLTGTKGASSFSYSCSGRPKLSVWPQQGTWSFDSSSPASAVVRDPGTNDAINVTYTVDATGQNLQLMLTYNGTGYTRVDNVQGNWTFNMIPQ